MMNDLHFLRPYWFIAIVPVLLLLLQFKRRRLSNVNWQSFCDPDLLPHILIGSLQTQKKWPIYLLAIAALLIIISLAGPVIEKLDKPVFREQSALIIVLDLSHSMDAEDIKPSRLTRAKHKIDDILVRRREGQTALVVYAGDAHVVSPLTQDTDTIINLAKTLETGLMPIQGSLPHNAIKIAVDLLQQSGVPSGHILLLTDGVTHDQAGDIISLVQVKGHRLSVLAVGTAQGAPIKTSSGAYVKDKSGSIVVPKLNASVLRLLAQQAGGRYHLLSPDDNDLNVLLGGDVALKFTLKKDEDAVTSDQWREDGPWLLLLVLPLAALVFRRGYLVFIAVLFLPIIPSPGYAYEWSDLWVRKNQIEAQSMQNDATYVAPVESFIDPSWRAVSHYRAGEYAQVIDELQHATTANDLYNKANALAQLGHFDEAISHYDLALEKKPDNEDIKYNKNLVQQQLNKDNENQEKNDQESSNRSSDDDKENDQGEDQREQEKSASQSKESKESEQSTSGQEDENAEGNNESDENNQNSDEENIDNNELKKDREALGNEAMSADEQNTEDDMLSEDELNKKEIFLANEQWLKRIPDDPGGLLRKKFLYEYQRNKNNKQTINEQTPW